MQILDLTKYRSRDLITIKCDYCNKDFQRSKKHIQQNIRNQQNMFCSGQCNSKYTNKHHTDKHILLICEYCNKEFKRKEYKLAKYHHYCSSECFYKHTNLEKPLCILCKKNRVSRINGKKCSECSKAKYDVWNMTLAECTYIGGPSGVEAKYARIREAARRFYKEQCKLGCQNCKYSKHVEVCHIKSISSYDPNTLVSEINDSKNIFILCRNCHWEFDHGLLII